MRRWDRIKKIWGLTNTRGQAPTTNPLKSRVWICNNCGYRNKPSEFTLEVAKERLERIICPGCHNMEAD